MSDTNGSSPGEKYKVRTRQGITTTVNSKPRTLQQVEGTGMPGNKSTLRRGIHHY